MAFDGVRCEEEPEAGPAGPPSHPPGVPPRLVALSEISWRLLVCGAAIGLLAYGLWQVRIVVLPIFIALLATTLLVPPARWLERRGVPSLLATAAVYIAALALVGAIGWLIVPPVVDELDELDRQLRAGVNQVGEYIVAGPFGVSEREIERAVEQAADQIAASRGAIVSGLLSGVQLVGQLIAGLLLSAVLVFFFVKDGPQLWRWVTRLFPKRRRAMVDRLGASSWEILGAYVRGVALVATVDAVLIGVALALIGVPLVLPLAVLTFFAAFFPLIGAFLAGLAAALVALVAQGVVAALIVVAAITAIQQLEGDLLYPVVVGRVVQLHPVAILLAIAAGAVVAGVIGALVAVPLAAVLSAAVPVLTGRDTGPEAS
jgi:predicted PurR-regulated permease PerM